MEQLPDQPERIRAKYIPPASMLGELIKALPNTVKLPELENLQTKASRSQTGMVSYRKLFKALDDVGYRLRR